MESRSPSAGAKLLYEAYPSMLRVSPFGFVISILLVPVFGVGILILLIWYLKTRMDKLMITSRDVIWTHGLLSKQNTEFNIGSVRTIKINQSLLQRMLKSGDVEIYTAGDMPEIKIAGLPDPSKIREIIKEQT